ncbi:TetR/AcrR family transcriptional regulator [Bacillus sp. ISL-47]|uniref:TetR/AcrR family transcriptional regulator n=1 Tax=Bacillus sp. ISL-47 TaxID=2819130 RepID=UPI001BEA5070|nr:TetR/AcrR family transcriptional regulator [Bacillus sp. ISL-47]MBT2686776.1 TetR/AcrR family transcriptional regulator [Bacillus sp. ISL-47]MBT2706872.1 TetR/AcrR family transcriptional regulator [Pseudomonas sp. ISL-84]
MENRKKQIVDLAIKLIQQKGYVAFSYDDISKQLGVTKASIHYHFEKKEDLGVAVTERILLRLQESLMLIKNSPVSAEEKLKQFIQQQAQRFEYTEICPISSLQTDYESLPTTVQEKIVEVSRLELSVMKEFVAEAQAENIINSSEDVHQVAVAILSSVKGALLYRRVLGDDVLAEVLNQLNLSLKKP